MQFSRTRLRESSQENDMAIQEVRWYFPLLALAVAGSLAACHSPVGPLSGKVTVDGSTTAFPLSKAMAAAFRQSNPAVQFAIDFSGTGGGFKKFCSGKVDIAGASRPIN
jgi:ABC-type phosphate transport system substrate-binding protein